MLNDSIYSRLADDLQYSWELQARPEQRLPPGDWVYLVLLTGRGWGKSRTLSETVRLWIKDGFNFVNLIGSTMDDVRTILVEGPSGILACCPPDERPAYKRRSFELHWPNGATSYLLSAEEPDRMRGKQHMKLAADEIAAWRTPDAWDQALFGLRLGRKPQAIIATTPRPTKIVKDLVNDPRSIVVRGSTFDNRANLSDDFVKQITGRFEGTRLGCQELYAELLLQVQGALFTADMIDRARAPVVLPDMQRVVVAVDPSGARGADDNKADAIGICVAGLGVDGRGYVLADLTCRMSPAGWGRRVVDAYHRYGADRVLAERNFGGAMVEHVIRTADPNVPYKEVTASRGKSTRAEPIAAVYEQNRVTHVASFPELEDELSGMTSTGFAGSGSQNRADALVWAVSELMLSAVPGSGWLDLYKAENDAMMAATGGFAESGSRRSLAETARNMGAVIKDL